MADQLIADQLTEEQIAEFTVTLLVSLNAKNPAAVPTFLQHCGGYGQVTDRFIPVGPSANALSQYP
jgi:hypothetical protein